MTNYERIKAMTFEELAEFLCANFDFDIDSAREMLKKNFDAIYNDESKTDNEIIKALEKIASYSGFTDNVSNTIKSTLDLINRLQSENKRLTRLTMDMAITIETCQGEAIKEFADKVVYDIDTYREKHIRTKPFVDGVTGMQIAHNLIYKRLREVVGEDK